MCVRRNKLAEDCRVQDGGTNQRAVLLAYQDALDSIRTNDLLNREGVTVVEVVTRQQIVTQIFNEWIHDWRRQSRNEFIISNGQRAANGDVIANILDAQQALGSHIQYFFVTLTFARQNTDPDEMEVAGWAEYAACH
eukprot:GHVU01071799.1.p1 GENE.GHVU01071799.1~~GHVU01071799.1.p1  ORF type:complete len:137 (-),score=14.16 GHVU01071799.1:218-628(-)